MLCPSASHENIASLPCRVTYSANRVTAPRWDVLPADEAVYKVQSPAAIPAGNHTLAVWFKPGPAAPIRSKRLPAYGHLNYE